MSRTTGPDGDGDELPHRRPKPPEGDPPPFYERWDDALTYLVKERKRLMEKYAPVGDIGPFYEQIVSDMMHRVSERGDVRIFNVSPIIHQKRVIGLQLTVNVSGSYGVLLVPGLKPEVFDYVPPMSGGIFGPGDGE